MKTEEEGLKLAMTLTRAFHLGDILSVTTERLVSLRHVEGVYDILNWMTGDSLFTHQLPRANDECRGPLLAQHPDLAEVIVPDDLSGEGPVREWLAGQIAKYGETREVARLAAVNHTRINPIAEMRMIRPDAEIICVAPKRLAPGDG